MASYAHRAMFYRKFAPSPHPSPVVECCFVWEKWDILTGALRIESPPTGFGSMVFNYGDAYRVGNDKHPSLQSYALELGGRIGMAGMVFKPAEPASYLS